jgi:hypothetical protein
MAGIENPGALAGATGAGAFHASAAGMRKIAQGEVRRHLEGTGGAHV